MLSQTHVCDSWSMQVNRALATAYLLVGAAKYKQKLLTPTIKFPLSNTV